MLNYSTELLTEHRMPTGAKGQQRVVLRCGIFPGVPVGAALFIGSDDGERGR